MTYNPADPIVIRPVKCSFEAFMTWLIVISLSALAATTVIFWVIHQNHWVHTQPVKTVTVTKTQVIHDDGLTSAQNAFIKQCEKADYDPDSSDQSVHLVYGVPNVEVQPWTCSLPKPS